MVSKNQTIKVGISIGDVNGIGMEIILKTLEDKNILEFFTPIIFGSTKLLNFQAKHMNLNSFHFNGIANTSEAKAQKINVVNLWKDPKEVDFGNPTKEAGVMAIESFVEAVKALQKGEIDVLVTAPFNKDTIQSEQYTHPGHTDYLASQFQEDALMVLTGDRLTVALVTQHLPISKVASHINKENILAKARALYQSLQKDFYIMKPKIAILGLNPHAGDNGLIGKEEKEMIQPAIAQLNKEGILAFGPYPSDSFFIPGVYNSFDGVLAMYHDQGLIPFKSIHFDDGVNFTAGLSKIRTSPDHGVAYDIAGKNTADETSFKAAIFKAIEIYQNRKQDAKDHENPLKITPVKDRKKEI